MSPASKVVIASPGHADIGSKPLIDRKEEPYKYDAEKEGQAYASPDETSVHEGEEKYRRLGWVKLTVCLIVEGTIYFAVLTITRWQHI